MLKLLKTAEIVKIEALLLIHACDIKNYTTVIILQAQNYKEFQNDFTILDKILLFKLLIFSSLNKPENPLRKK